MRFKPIKISFLFIFLISLSAFADVESSLGVARVVQFTGKVSVSETGSEKKEISKNEVINQHAVLTTGAHSSVTLLLNDRSLIKIGANSTLQMDFLAKDSDQVELNLENGVVKSIVHKRVDKVRSFHIRTPSATMGVRGTEFAVSVSIDAAESFHEAVFVLRGSVLVADMAGAALSLVKSGMGLGFTATNGPNGLSIGTSSLNPRPLSESQMQQLRSEQFLTAPKMMPPLPGQNGGGGPGGLQPNGAPPPAGAAAPGSSNGGKSGADAAPPPAGQAGGNSPADAPGAGIPGAGGTGAAGGGTGTGASAGAPVPGGQSGTGGSGGSNVAPPGAPPPPPPPPPKKSKP